MPRYIIKVEKAEVFDDVPRLKEWKPTGAKDKNDCDIYDYTPQTTERREVTTVVVKAEHVVFDENIQEYEKEILTAIFEL